MADTPPGPGSVQYDLTLDGDRYTGTLTYASVLTGLKGFRDDPIDPIDLLVLRTVPGDTCRPKSTSLIPLDAVWVLEPLPDSPGTHTLTPGPMPGDTSAKTWTWDGKTGASHNMGLDGTVTVTRTLANGRLEGTIDVVARPYFETTTLGTLRGGFVAQPIDCSTWTGGFPM